MGWIDGEVDGVAVKVRSITATAEWAAVKEKFLEYEAAALSDRENMGTGFADPFNDTSDLILSDAYLIGGALRNTVIAAQAGDAIVPNMTAASQNGYTASASSTGESRYPWHAFNADLSYPYSWYSLVNEIVGWLCIQLPVSTVVTSYSISAFTYEFGLKCIPRDWQFQGSNDKSTWDTLDTRSDYVDWTAGEQKSFNTSNTTAYLYYRLNITKVVNPDTAGYVCVGKFQLYSAPTPEVINLATVTLNSYAPAETLEAIKVKLWLEDLDNTGAISCGAEVTDKIRAYLSYDSNTSFGSAITFTEEPVPIYEGSNTYIFTSDEIDTASESIMGLGLKVQSFDTGSGAPNFNFHCALVMGRPSSE